MYQVIATGSTGNAIIYHNIILVDCGVPYSLLKPYVKDIQIVLLTHVHGDHINTKTIKKLIDERPTLRIGACEWWRDYLIEIGAKNYDLFKIGEVYDYGAFKISPVQLYHDVPNCGYRIFKDKTKIFHATDTAHLSGISAKEYDLYAIEHNYNEDTVYDTIRELEAKGKFAHQRGSLNSHLSEQQARGFIAANRAEHSKVLRLHETSFSL